MTRKSLFFIFLFLTASTCCEAATFVLKGKVADGNRNGIELATVACMKQGVVEMTNLKGEYKITLQSADSVEIRFSMVGFQTRKRMLYKPHGTVTMNVILPGIELSEVVVTERRRQIGTEEHIDVKGIKTMPSVTGNGVEELIQQQAGVSTHSELSSQYNVRGGSFDENSVYINDVEVYRPLLIRSGEQEGLSIINPDMVEEINFSAGGFAAQYADKMSSALDIRYKKVKGEEKRIGGRTVIAPKAEGSLGASLLGANAYIGLGTSTLSWTNGLRYKTNRYLLGSLETTGEYRPNQLDYQTYLSWAPNKRWTLDFIGNISENHYNFEPHNRETNFGTLDDVRSFTVYFDGQEKDVFRTLFGNLSLTRHFGDFINVSLMASAFHSKEKETYDIQGQYWLNESGAAESLGVGTYMEHARNYLTYNVASLKLLVDTRIRSHSIKGGITYKIEDIKEDSREYEMRDSSGYSVPHSPEELALIYSLRSKNKLESNRIEVFLQDTYKFKSMGGTFYTLNYGARFSHWDYNGESLLSPRASLTIIPSRNPDLTLRFAAGIYYQTPFYKELRDTVTEDGVTHVQLNQNIKSQRSIHFIAGADYRFRVNDRPYRFSAEAYYKALSDLIPYNINNVKIVYYGQNMCSGHTAGVDAKIYGEFVPGADSWFSLGYMTAKQNLNGKSIPMPTDQGFSASLFFTDFFPNTTRWKMTLRGAYVGGLPFGPPHTGLEKQVFRAPAYKRVDIGMSYRALNNDDGEGGKKDSHKFFRNIWLEVDCFNIFGFNNVNSYYWVTDVMNQQYAVPNYLTGRQLNARVLFEF